MSYTSFGEFVRILRIKHHEVMGDLAKVLEVKVPFLSAVENGKKNVPSEWVNKLIEHYKLSLEDQEELKKSIAESRTQYKISATEAGISQRRVALQFARSFDGLDDETAIKIMELLTKKEDRKD